MARTELTNFDPAGMTIGEDSLSNIVIAQTRHSFSAVMNITTKRIFVSALSAPLAGQPDHYQTQTPLHQDAFPQKLLGSVIAPIIHKNPVNPITSHSQLAQAVIGLGGGASEDDFCGFSLRFEDGTAALSPTSRSLNPGYSGGLENCIKQELIIYLGPKLDRLGFRLGGGGGAD